MDGATLVGGGCGSVVRVDDGAALGSSTLDGAEETEETAPTLDANRRAAVPGCDNRRLVLIAARTAGASLRWAGHGVHVEAIEELAVRTPQTFASTELGRCDSDVRRVDKVGFEELADGCRAATEANVHAPAASWLAARRPLERRR